MQPPPRNTPPGGSGPPPSGPNMFRRTRPPKHPAAAQPTMPPVTHPMTDPFAFVRAPPPMPAGGPTIPSSTPLQALPNNAQSQAHTGLPLQPLSPPSALPGSASSSLPGMTLFNPQGAASLPVHPDPPTGAEQSYFNSRDQIPPAPSEPPQAASGPIPSQTAFNHEFQERPSQPLPFQPMVPPYPSSQWTPDHGSRPPSVQNYFQPTNDPPPFDLPPQNQMFPANNQVAHHGALAPSVQPGHPHIQGPIPLQNPANTLNTQWPDPNTPHPHHPHHHNPPFQAQGYFSQSSAPQEPWFNQPPSDSGYHQMGKSTAPPQPDIGAAQHMSNLGPDIASGPSLGPYPHEASALSMFFKDDVENEETLAGERSQVNGGSGSVPHHVHQQPICSQGDDQPPPPLEHSHPQYMNDGNYASQGSTQKPSDTQDRHAENLEYVPNQEVLPSETHCTPAATSVEQFETGPNLETPDSVSRPMRSASVSSNYSNISHGSGTATRRHQGVAGTFIQQESPRLSDEATVSPASGRYFEQIDTSPAGVSCSQQSSLEQMWPSTPSPPKPTGNFQASANSSFEPVRSHGVGVRPPEVDKAKMEAEGGVDSAPGNLEQPPDNMENIYGSGHSLPVASGTVSLSTNPVVHSHSRPSSRAFGASRPCESPATTLWAQNDPASLSTNIVLAPAAPTILAPLREPSTDVIQPPEDGPLDLQPLQRAQQMSQQHLENLENPPKSTNGFYLQVTKDAQQGIKVAENLSAHTTSTSSTPQTISGSQAAGVSGLQPPQVQYPAPAPMPAPGISAPPGPPLGSTVPPGTAAPPGPATGNAAPFWPGPGNAAPLGPHPAITAPPEPAIGAAAPPGPPPGSIVPPRPAATPGPATGSAAPTADVHPAAPRGPVSSGGSQSGPAEPPRPPSSAGSQHGYGPPHPSHGQPYGGYYYGEYLDSRASYPSGQYPPPPVDLRAQQYYQDGQYRSRADGWYGRYEGHPAAYRDQNYQYREPQPERPSSRTSQYSDRPSSRQGYQDDYNRAKRTAYNDYYADYKHYDYAGYNYGQYDPRHRGYYDQAYWSYDDAYRARDYYNHQMYPPRKEGYDDQWQYYPGYDSSFDDDYRRRGDIYNDDFDRRSVHSEQSAHSVHSSHSQHSRRSSFSSRSQQSQVYRSQPDLVSAVYDTTSSTLAVDYSYGQYPAQNDVSQNYYGYPEYNADSTWTAPEQPPPRPATPEKFTMPHCCARFGPGGHLVQVLPNLPSAGQPALVDIHSMEVMLQDTPEQSELRSFPGPLVREETHKVDVIKFSQNKALECARDNNLLDRDSARLLWDFIVLLCRQNGTVVGTDIADLLLKEHRSVWLPGKSPNEANLIDFNNEPLARAEEEPGAGPLSLLSDTFMTVPENVGKETERFRELLLFGRKKDALEAAMKAGLWGHALLLASKMDNRTHARVMTRFANSLPINDPLQTVYQLMSGRMPASATCCGEEKWGDWRPHLAMVLSNLTHTLDLDTRTITTMGDTLASKGLLDAAHFCYLMAQVGLGVFTKKSTKMVLIGSNHSLPFFQFATNEAIQRTEAYEYAQSLGSQPCSLPNFQVFKFIYACRLAESGLSAQAFHYCEVVSRTVLMHPGYYSPFFISQIIQMSEKLRFFDPQLKEKPEQELFNEPEWLMELRQLDGQIRTGVIQYNEERATPTQFGSSSPSSELDEQGPPEPNTIPTDVDGPTPDNPLMSSLLPGPPPQGVQLMPPAPTSILQDGMTISQPDVPQFYPVPPSCPPGHIPMSGYPSQDHCFAPPPFQPQPEHSEMYPGSHPCPPSYHAGQIPPHMPPQVPHSPAEMHHSTSPIHQHMPPSPGHMPSVDQLAHTPLEISSPRRSSFTQQKDLYDQMAHMVSGRRSRTTSESSTHSGGRERSNSAIKQVSPPPPSIPEQPPKEEPKKTKRDSPKKGGGGGGWFKNLFWKGKNEAHLPDDKNKSIVWDEQKQKWVDQNEPEEESKPPPPPPSGFPSMPQMPGPAGPGAPSSSGPPVNMFSRKAAPDDHQPLEGSEGGNPEQNSPNAMGAPQMFNPTLLPPAPEVPAVPDGSQSGESQPAQGTGGITFYNPAQFTQTSAAPGGGQRSGRLGGQRQYPVLK
ncbi:Protein transport protein [Takifugu flavidus]|uniref:Protein transport protein sec16 n=1 Tax=Takifugu flavidus TaxID=433684 RepID=A0A5C6NL62_9TELE|nr:Protein transport protein [Takifugu flavidus]